MVEETLVGQGAGNTCLQLSEGQFQRQQNTIFLSLARSRNEGQQPHTAACGVQIGY